jgi:hypothetical protein
VSRADDFSEQNVNSSFTARQVFYLALSMAGLIAQCLQEIGRGPVPA